MAPESSNLHSDADFSSFRIFLVVPFNGLNAREDEAFVWQGRVLAGPTLVVPRLPSNHC